MYCIWIDKQIILNNKLFHQIIDKRDKGDTRRSFIIRKRSSSENLRLAKLPIAPATATIGKE